MGRPLKVGADIMKRKYFKALNAFLGIAVFVFMSAFCGACGVRAYAADAGNTDLDAAKQIIKQYYIEDVPDQVLNSADGLKSLVGLLNDPYSAYFTEDEYESFKNSINNTFSGIGMQIDKTDKGIVVTSVFKGTPAEAAGIKEGDVILSVDGYDLSQASAEEAISRIKGEAGTSVSLVIKRNDTVIETSAERKEIILPTVTESVLDGHIGYIVINSFGSKTTEEFESALSKLEASSVDSYIVDIRNNSGGYMDVAIDIAGRFIGDETALVTKDRNGNTTAYEASGKNGVITKPVILLTNRYSASASEILAAALKDNKKAYIIGETTFGKGVAQSLYKLPGGGYLKLTTLRFMSPLGNEINKIGVKPDMEVSDSDGKSPLLEAEKMLNRTTTPAKKAEVLPATGSMFDFESLVSGGAVLVACGTGLFLAGRKKCDN